MKDQLINPDAIALAETAISYVRKGHETWSADLEMIQAAAQDYVDLMTIASMIEEDVPRSKIAQKIWHLDTYVRDKIPDKVFSKYCA